MRSKLPAAGGPRSLTLILSLWLLGIIAVFQLFALTFKVVPPIGGKLIAESTGAVDPGGIYRPNVTATPALAEAAAPAQPPAQSPEAQQALALLAESQKFQRIGDWEKALPFLQQAVALQDQDPAVLSKYAYVLGRLQREEEALAVLKTVLAMPRLEPAARLEVQKLASFLEQTHSNVQSIAPPKASPVDVLNPTNLATNESPSGPLLEADGFQPGAALGIVNVRKIELDKDNQTLRIGIKSRPGSKVDNRNTEVRVKFFEKTGGGDVVLTESKGQLEWISQPIDWKDDLPELVDAICPLPGTKAASPTAAGNSYYGYTVGIYFNGELQDSRSEPENLQVDFPLELFLSNK